MWHNPLRSLAIALLAVIVATPVVWAHDSGFGLARYATDGQLDRSFGSDGVVVIRSALRSFVADALALQPDGKIIIAGMNSDLSTASLQLAIMRYMPDGTPDVDFGVGGLAATPAGSAGAQANALAVQPDGKVVVVGTTFGHGGADDEFLVARYLSNGASDASFGANGLTTTHVGAAGSAAQALALQADGGIVVVGTAFANGSTDDDFALVRYTSAGALDDRFGSGGIVTTDFSLGAAGPNPSLDRATAVGLQPDGAIVVAGFTRGEHQVCAGARYSATGTLDPAFGAAGRAHVAAREPQTYALALEPSGEIVVAGSVGSVDGKTAPFALVRLHRDGQPDERFGVRGLVTTALEGSRSGVHAVVAAPDGRLVTGGARFGAPSAQGDALRQSGFALARYGPDGMLDKSFGAHGTTLTDMGDAGALPLSLALQPDGKIVAAGLVFFQVAAATTPVGPQVFVQPIATAVAGAAVLLLVVVGLVVRRRRNRISH